MENSLIEALMTVREQRQPQITKSALFMGKKTLRKIRNE
jgi:hypothetical protein